ncbi:hypothetical protein [[Kitasatospora] papulosa]|uniref:hypothetical protein n=1 Tax=[Kitasatospora] papulosa TaxID=1464011 RepID=UPI0036A65760
MVGIYASRRDAPDSERNTSDLARFVSAVNRDGDEYIYFTSVQATSFTFLCVLSNDLQTAIACTSVSSSHFDPLSRAVGEVDIISQQQAAAVLRQLEESGWESARLALHSFKEGANGDVKVWLASPKALAEEFGRFDHKGSASLITSRDAEPFVREMRQRQNDGVFLKIFHVLDLYGWQVTCAYHPVDLDGVACVGVKRT